MDLNFYAYCYSCEIFLGKVELNEILFVGIITKKFRTIHIEKTKFDIIGYDKIKDNTLKLHLQNANIQTKRDS